MRRRILAGALAALLAVTATGCASRPGDDRPVPFDAHRSTDLTVWNGWNGREAAAFHTVVRDFTRLHPNVHVSIVDGVDDSTIMTSIRGGYPPDVAAIGSTTTMGTYCSTGAFRDLTGYLRRDHVTTRYAPVIRRLLDFHGTQCVMPGGVDTFGLYYNTDRFAQAGLDRPPRTWSEFVADAKKLTTYNPDGSIRTLGFDPLFSFQQNTAIHWSPSFGAGLYDAHGRSALAANPGWRRMFEAQRQLVAAIGYQKLQRFQAGLGAEMSAANAFQAGKVAMQFDGEWRTAFIADQAPKLSYDTAGLPVADDRAGTYGAGFVDTGVFGIPQGAREPGAAWELVKYLTQTRAAQVKFYGALGNVPSLPSAASDPAFTKRPHFGTFVDIMNNPHSGSGTPTTLGRADKDALDQFAERWQAGRVPDLAAGLRGLARQIDDLTRNANPP
ncbi:ABC transporter substrate-binding protein [Actinocatenispora rupis]|uniref:Probable sugar-binding periplasmic protein n=1 Tax=Actinocatenispora rupis TaxID=519421 RepID=A0A8J3J2V5_9ACTN|nr:ABC transporter substrate-binding protein [Actinocatenispora rupis]GID10967.1 sugar ABC transporter substrate-binding protein [Actinocatenispora rupis]